MRQRVQHFGLCALGLCGASCCCELFADLALESGALCIYGSCRAASGERRWRWSEGGGVKDCNSRLSESRRRKLCSGSRGREETLSGEGCRWDRR